MKILLVANLLQCRTQPNSLDHWHLRKTIIFAKLYEWSWPFV